MKSRMIKPQHRTPKLPPHWHPGECSCELGVAYIRVSKVGKRDRIISPELQLDAIVLYAKANNIRLLKVVPDIDRSGRTFRKRSVDRIIEEIRSGAYRRVILWKWSRWARNTVESTKYLQKVRDVAGRVDSATEDIDQETAIGRLQMDLIMRIDQYQSEQLSEGFISAHEKRREDGLPHSGRPRFGYTYVTRRKTTDGEVEVFREYVVNKKEAPLLKAAYADHVKGVSFERIARTLNGAGLKTTMGGTWTAQGVTQMMDTGFAAGWIRERSKPDGKPANRFCDYDIWRRGKHEAIVDDSVWQQYRAKREAVEKLPPRAVRAVHELSALMICARCGRRLQTKYTGQARQHQWQCTWRKLFHPDAAVSVSNRLAIRVVRDWVREVAGAGESVDPQARLKFEKWKSDRDLPDPDKITTEIKRWQKRLKNLRDLYNDEDITREEFRESRDEYEAEIHRLSKVLTDIANAAPERPDYSAFRALDEEWALLDKGEIRDALARLVGLVLVSPRTASSTNASVADRVELVGRWEVERLSRMQRLA